MTFDASIPPPCTPRTVEDVRALYHPATDYRISPYTHRVGARFEEEARTGTVHVLTGSCEFRFPNHTIALSTGESATLPSGVYSFEVKGAASVELVRVWHLPSMFDLVTPNTSLERARER